MKGMQMLQQKLKLLVKAYRTLADVKWGTRTVKGNLPPLNQSVADMLAELDAASLIENIFLDGNSLLITDIDAITHAGAIFQVELEIIQGPDIPFVKGFQDLLKLSTPLTRKPIGFFIADLDYYSEDDKTPPDIVSKYFSVLGLVDILHRIADFADSSDSRVLKLVFLLKEKYEVRVEYTVDDVEKMSQSDTLLHFIESTPHQANKQDILKGIVVDVAKTSVSPFTTLISSLNEVTRRATDNYAVFVSEFSFDKIRDEIEKRKSEFILRINKVFSDIQDKLLSVPLALVVASTQIDAKSSYSKNTGIICGISIFTILMLMLIKNQFHNLNAIKEEHSYQQKLLEKEYAVLHSKVNDAFVAINSRRQGLWLKLYFVTFLVFVNYAISYTLYYKWTETFWRAIRFLWQTR